jgi:putative SOS response-associated peptidase YedK
MCGRFMLSIVESRLSKLIGVDFAVTGLVARYNIAPTQPVIAVRVQNGRRETVLLRWGLVPSWAEDVAIGNRMINARSETAHEKPSFRHAFRRRRCLIPADGFYEWSKAGMGSATTPGGGGGGGAGGAGRGRPVKQPYLITMADEGPFAMAGLWEHWQDAAGNELETCTILTTAANELVGELHDRMPVILDPNDYGTWLDPANEDVAIPRGLCKPFPAELMMHRPVGTYINSPKHEGPRCVRPPGATDGVNPAQNGEGGQTPTLF